MRCLDSIITNVCNPRCKYYVLLIQLHHPLIARANSVPSTFEDPFAICDTAAKEIMGILVAYDRTFSIRKAPYLIAYATYVSATIHARAAARRIPSQETVACLRTCLDFLDQNRDTNPGVDNAKISLTNLMNRLGVGLDGPSASESRNHTALPSSSRLSDNDSISNYVTSQSSAEEGYGAARNLLANSRINSQHSMTPDLDVNSILQIYAESQSQASHSNSSMNTQIHPARYQPPLLPSSLDFSAADSFEAPLLDPAGVDYGQASFGGGELPNMYQDIAGFERSMQYNRRTGGPFDS